MRLLCTIGQTEQDVSPAGKPRQGTDWEVDIAEGMRKCSA